MLNFLKFNLGERFVTSSKKIEPPEILRASQMEVEIAALLHDIGHGPFGHTMDFLLDRIGWDPDKRHEYFGVKKIKDENSMINRRLVASTKDSDMDLRNICRLIEGNPPVAISGKDLSANEMFRYSFLGQIIGSAVNADRIDYLMRDSYHTGVRMVSIDLTGIFEALRLFGGPTTVGKKDIEIDLAFDLKGMWAIEGMLLSHIAMYKTVYHNITHRILQEMVVRAFEAYIEEEYGNPTKLLEKDVYALMNLTDHESMTLLQEHKESKEILNRVIERRPYHCVLEIPWSRMSPLVKKLITKFQGAKEAIPALERVVSKECANLSPRGILIDLPTLKTLTVEIPLVEKGDDGTYRLTTLTSESDVAVMLGKIPFVDKMTVAVADEQEAEKTKKKVKELFYL